MLLTGVGSEPLAMLDPKIPVMSWENARDKGNLSRAFRVKPVYLS